MYYVWIKQGDEIILTKNRHDINLVVDLISDHVMSLFSARNVLDLKLFRAYIAIRLFSILIKVKSSKCFSGCTVWQYGGVI